MPSAVTSVCVLTSRGMAAISSIAVAGPGAWEIVEKVFRGDGITERRHPACADRHANTTPQRGLEARVPLTASHILHGVIVDGERVIDEVVVGCESDDTFVIHCHGNPLLVERIVKLFQSHGAKLTDAESFASARHRKNSRSTIEAEAKLAMQKSATLLGVKILQAQINGGLSTWTQQCVDNFDTMNPQDIKDRCHHILEHSRIAKRIIEGVQVVIAGPPNSGKSTLLNCLAGQQQAVVSDTAGTTRDWVSVTCQLGPIKVEFIDTAGLDEALAGKDTIEQTAQAVTKELLESSDLVLYVRDMETVISDQLSVFSHCLGPIIDVYNKCDLIQEHKNTGTQEPKNSGTRKSETVFVSAKCNDGIDLLAEQIMNVLKVSGFDSAAPVAFTYRQQKLLSAIMTGPDTAKEGLKRLLCSENEL